MDEYREKVLIIKKITIIFLNIKKIDHLAATKQPQEQVKVEELAFGCDHLKFRLHHKQHRRQQKYITTINVATMYSLLCGNKIY